MKEIDVESENSPNPYANEIQNCLYENDEYNYNKLYGDTPPKQQNTWDTVKKWGQNVADATQAASVGYATGASLGNFDEAMGAVTAAVTRNPDNYAIGRDATRKLQNDLNQQHPYIYGGAEFLGAMQTPMHLLKDTSKANKALNAFTDTLNASAGYAENWDDFGKNLIANGIANTAGLFAGGLPFFRALGSSNKGKFVKPVRKFIKQGINFVTDKTKDMIYNREDNGEE